MSMTQLQDAWILCSFRGRSSAVIGSFFRSNKCVNFVSHQEATSSPVQRAGRCCASCWCKIVVDLKLCRNQCLNVGPNEGMLQAQYAFLLGNRNAAKSIRDKNILSFCDCWNFTSCLLWILLRHSGVTHFFNKHCWITTGGYSSEQCSL